MQTDNSQKSDNVTIHFYLANDRYLPIVLVLFFLGMISVTRGRAPSDSDRHISVVSPSLQSTLTRLQRPGKAGFERRFYQLLQQARKINSPIYKSASQIYRHVSHRFLRLFQSLSERQKRKISRYISSKSFDVKPSNDHRFLSKLLDRAHYRFYDSSGRKAAETLFRTHYFQANFIPALYWSKYLQKLNPARDKYTHWTQKTKEIIQERIQDSSISNDVRNTLFLWRYPSNYKNREGEWHEYSFLTQEPYLLPPGNKAKKKFIQKREKDARHSPIYDESPTPSYRIIPAYQSGLLFISNGDSCISLDLKRLQKNDMDQQLAPSIRWIQQRWKFNKDQKGFSWRNFVNKGKDYEHPAAVTLKKHAFYTVLGNTLYKGDLHTGRIYWKRQVASPSDPARFDGIPIVRNNLVHVILKEEIRVNSTWKIHVMAFSKSEGRSIWETKLGEISLLLGQKQQKNSSDRVIKSYLSQKNGALLYWNNRGLLGSLSALTGRIFWIRTYEGNYQYISPRMSSKDEILMMEHRTNEYKKQMGYHPVDGDAMTRMIVNQEENHLHDQFTWLFGDQLIKLRNDGLYGFIRRKDVNKYIPELPFKSQSEFMEYSTRKINVRTGFQLALKRFIWRYKALQQQSRPRKQERLHLTLLALFNP